jgi:hypothetical protein
MIKNWGKKDIVLNLYCLYIIFLSASCSNFFISVKAQVIFLVFSFFMLVRKQVKWIDNVTGRLLLCSFAGVVFLHFVISNVFMLGSIKFFAMLLSVFYVMSAYPLTFFRRLIDIIYLLTVITVPFYIFQLLNFDLLRSLLAPLNFSFTNQSNVGGVYIFLFNVSPVNWGELYRNSGFMWEPGAFGGMLVFTIVYYFISSNFQVGKRILFLMIYALTTVSTATIFALFFFITLILITKYRKSSYVLLGYFPILVLLGIEVYSLPFMGGKIAYYFETNLDYQIAYQFGNFDEGGTSIGRFSGFLIELERFKESPLIGHGWDSDYSKLGIGNEWSNPSGLSVLMGKFGLVGLLFVLIALYKLPFYSPISNIYQRIILILVILIPVFSNPFQINLVFWSFVMLGVVNMSNHRLHLKVSRSKANAAEL